MRRQKGVPVLLAIPYQTGKNRYQVKVWCPFCVTFHLHGGIDEGHREAHCVTGPFKETGYYFKIDRENKEHVQMLKAYKASQT